MRIWLLLLCSALIMQPICAHPISDKGTKNSDDVLYALPRFYVAQRDWALCARGSACALESGLERGGQAQEMSKLDSTPTYYKPDPPSTYLNTTIGLLGGGIVVSIIGLYIMPESVTNWDRSRFGFKAWLQDVQIGPLSLIAIISGSMVWRIHTLARCIICSRVWRDTLGQNLHFFLSSLHRFFGSMGLRHLWRSQAGRISFIHLL